MYEHPWAVFVLANHSRREILIRAAPTLPPPPVVQDDAEGPPTQDSGAERRLLRSDSTAQWDLALDQIVLLDAVVVGAREPAEERARRARGNPIGLLEGNPHAVELIEQRYDVLVGEADLAGRTTC